MSSVCVKSTSPSTSYAHMNVCMYSMYICSHVYAEYSNKISRKKQRNIKVLARKIIFWKSTENYIEIHMQMSQQQDKLTKQTNATNSVACKLVFVIEVLA